MPEDGPGTPGPSRNLPLVPGRPPPADETLVVKAPAALVVDFLAMNLMYGFAIDVDAVPGYVFAPGANGYYFAVRTSA